MPITTHRRSPSPINLSSLSFNNTKQPSSPLHSPTTLNISTISSTSSSSSSSTTSFPIDNHCSSPSTTFTTLDLWTLYDFESHARLCTICRSTYHSHTLLDPNQHCYTGRDLAQKVTNVVYSKARAVAVGEDRMARIRLPQGYTIVASLVRGVEADLRRRRGIQHRPVPRRADPERPDTRPSAQVSHGVRQARSPPASSTSNGVAVTVVELDEKRDSAITLPHLSDDEEDAYGYGHGRRRSDEQPRPPTRGKPRAEVETPAATLKRSPRAEERRASTISSLLGPRLEQKMSAADVRVRPVVKIETPTDPQRWKRSTKAEGRPSSSSSRLSNESKRTTTASTIASASAKSSTSKSEKTRRPDITTSRGSESRPGSRKSTETGGKTSGKAQEALEESKARSKSPPTRKRRALWMWFLT